MNKPRDKKCIGVGGIACPCCRQSKDKKTTRAMVNRRARHKAKQQLNDTWEASQVEMYE